jgi:acetyl-CoA carboxylase biotin carboxyl carrier protein
MADDTGGTPQELTTLRDHARSLATELPGALRRIRVRSGDRVIEVEWQLAKDAAAGGPSATAGPPTLITVDAAGEAESADPALDLVLAPMVGTFYRAPEPGADPFVQVGDSIEAGRVVGIIEAMKLMNPIQAEVSGVVTAVLVSNAETVEFGQPLIAVEQPSS